MRLMYIRFHRGWVHDRQGHNNVLVAYTRLHISVSQKTRLQIRMDMKDQTLWNIIGRGILQFCTASKTVSTPTQEISLTNLHHVQIQHIPKLFVSTMTKVYKPLLKVP